ncbi:major facilitator superfamily MFS_1 [Actinokineospora spheciospongiae]|uniref:Major facilitator superfamily MFS_1 n=1 Tax=Actinokineospora spheciospongiae TaxID=909613 RepID=W7JD99_9PSEU|nr:MFS transporter [Actinokineospora spheciospongiae]EWC63984.1 major facilitator superfamily MFS_1 [Actinokineospora spheciospongiae]
MSTPAARRATPLITLIAVCVSCGLLPASLTGTSIALPAIGSDLGAALVSLQWVVNAYNLAFAGVMLAAGALADLLGRKRMFATGLVVFVACTAGVGLVSDIVTIDVLRAVAGIGAAMVLTAGSALLAQAYSGPAQMKAFGALGSSFGLGLALGPSTSGILVDLWGWRSVFLVHAAIALAVLVALPSLRESRDPEATGVDWKGTTTFSGGLVALTLALVEGPQRGWADPLVLALFAVFAVLIAGFVVVERAQVRPMFDLNLFRQPRFVAVCLMPVLLAFGFVCLLVFLPSFFIGIAGMGPQQAGLTMLLLTVPVLVFPVIAGAVVKAVPTHVLLGLSLVLVAAGAAWLTTIDRDAATATLIGPLLVIGTGVGISFGLLDGAAIGTVDPARAGMAAGMFNTMRLTGEAVAIAGMGSLLVSLTQGRLADGIAAHPGTGEVGEIANDLAQGKLGEVAATVPEAARGGFVDFAATAYTGAFHTVLWILAAVCAVGAPVIVLMLRERATTPSPEADAALPAAS